MDQRGDVPWEEKAEAIRQAARRERKALREAFPEPAAVAPEAAVFRAGVAEVDITPAEPGHLDGYWNHRPTSRVRDRLMARALVLDDGRTRVALVVSDLIAYFFQWVERARALQSAVPARNVVLCATHTHASPCLLGIFGPPGSVDDGYVAWAGERMAEAVERAAANLRPARVGFGKAAMPVVDGEIPNFARNWHNPGVVDPDVLLAHWVDARTGAPIATLLNVGNHPDVLGDHTTEMSADYLSFVYDALGRHPGGTVLAVQRALGGVEPIPQGVNDPAETEAAMEAVAGVAIEAARRAFAALEWQEAPRLSVRRFACRFPVTSPEVLKAHAMGLMSVGPEGGVQRNEMLLLEIGDAQFLTVPGEPHPEVVFKLADMMTGRFRFVLSMAQDEIGYVVPRELFNPAGIQELLSAGRDNEFVVLTAAAELLGVAGYVVPECLSSPPDAGS